MRFLVNGVDIPNRLIEAQERGEVVFLCGAGVSFGAGLPSFKGLVDEIYAKLNEHLDHYPTEKEAYEQKAFDRVLGILTRRIGETDAHDTPLVKREIRKAVRAALESGAKELPDHAALLQLSRNIRQEICLVTTNFDTLFETAACEMLGQNVESHASQALPGPQTERFSGVLHLHGRLENQALDLTDTDLVLTSAEFGDAYLRSGWAARWLYDLTRTATIVLVGYSADDPPMRYLLETLDADRGRFTDLKPIYAFSSAQPGETGLVADQWLAKGVTPIIYTSDTGDHSALYDSLREWATAADDPRTWRDARLRSLLAQTPDRQTIDEVIYLLRSIDGTRLLRDANPDTKWIEPLVSANAFKDGRPSPALWIARNLADPNAVSQWAKHNALDDYARAVIQRELEALGEKLPAAFRRAWQGIIRSARYSQLDLDERTYSAIDSLKRGDTRASILGRIVRAVTPKLKVSGSLRFFDKRELPERIEDYRLSDLVWIEFDSNEVHPVNEIIAAAKADLKVASRMARRLDAALNDSLEDAQDYGYVSTGFDRSSNDVRSVAPHQQNQHASGFYPITRCFVDVLSCLDDETPEYVSKLAQSSFSLRRRIALHLCSLPSVPASTASEALIALSDEDFWDGDTRRESMRLMSRRWSEFSSVDRRTLERRIIGGAPKALFNEEATQKEIREFRARHTYLRLRRLLDTGHTLDDASHKKLAAISRSHKYLKGPVSEREEFSSWSETRHGLSGDVSAVASASPETLLPAARALEEAKPWEQGNLRRVLAGKDPDRFLEALNAEMLAGRSDKQAWSILLGSLHDDQSEARANAVATSLLSEKDEALRSFATDAAWFVRRQLDAAHKANKKPRTVYRRLYARLIDLVFNGAPTEGDEQDYDLDTATLNSAPGHLATLAVDAFARYSRSPSKGKSDAEKLLLRMIRSGGQASVIATAVALQRLARLHYVSPDWCEENLVPPLVADTPSAHALWRARASDDHPGNGRLVSLIKPALLATLRRGDLPDHSQKNLLVHLLLSLIWKEWGLQADQPVTSGDVKLVLTFGPPAFRQHTSWQLARWIEGDKLGPAKAWKQHFEALILSIWPRDAKLKDSNDRLIDIAAAAGDAFPYALDAMMPFLKAGGGLKSLYRFRRNEDKLAIAFPDACLRLFDMLMREPKDVAYDLDGVLTEMADAHPRLAKTAPYKRLQRLIAASRA